MTSVEAVWYGVGDHGLNGDLADQIQHVLGGQLALPEVSTAIPSGSSP